MRKCLRTRPRTNKLDTKTVLEFQKILGILNWIDKRHYSHKTKLMKDSIFEIALELIKMAKTSVWYFFRNVSSISNSTQHYNEFLVSMARRRHRHKSLYSFFCFAVFPRKVCTKYSKRWHYSFYLQLIPKSTLSSQNR